MRPVSPSGRCSRIPAPVVELTGTSRLLSCHQTSRCSPRAGRRASHATRIAAHVGTAEVWPSGTAGHAAGTAERVVAAGGSSRTGGRSRTRTRRRQPAGGRSGSAAAVSRRSDGLPASTRRWSGWWWSVAAVSGGSDVSGARPGRPGRRGQPGRPAASVSGGSDVSGARPGRRRWSGRRTRRHVSHRDRYRRYVPVRGSDGSVLRGRYQHRTGLGDLSRWFGRAGRCPSGDAGPDVRLRYGATARHGSG